MRRRPPRSTRTYTLFPYTTLFRTCIHASVAQLAEQRSPKPQVVGSSPTWRATCGSYAKRGSSRTNPPTGQSGNFVNSREIGRAHVSTPVTNAHLVCRLLLENKTQSTNRPFHKPIKNLNDS